MTLLVLGDSQVSRVWSAVKANRECLRTGSHEAASMGEINRGGLADLDRKSRSGFFSSRCIEIIKVGEPGCPRLFALFSRSFGDQKSRLISTSRIIPTKKSRDNSRGNIEMISFTPRLLELSRLFSAPLEQNPDAPDPNRLFSKASPISIS